MRFPYRDFKRDWHPGDRFCRCRSIKMRFYRHIDIYKVEFMLNKYLKRWVQFVDTVIWVTNTTEYTELIGSEVASKWFSHSWMIARTLPKQAHPGRRSPRARFAGTGGFAARGGGHIITLKSPASGAPFAFGEVGVQLYFPKWGWMWLHGES